MVNFNGRTDSKETHDVESLRQIVVTVRNLLAPAIRLAGDPDDPKSSGAMQSAGIKELEISFIQSVERAMKELSRWGGACESAWNRLIIEQGMAPGKPPAKHSVKAAAKHAPAKKAKKAAKKR
jgi:hypothetical protein